MTNRADDAPMTINIGVAIASLALTVVGLGSAWYAFRNVAPLLTIRWWGAYVAVLLTAFVVVVGSYAVQSPAVRDAQSRHWARAGEVLQWGTWLALQGIVWLLLPWGTNAMQLVTLLFSTGSMAAIFVTSLDAPGMARIRVGTLAVSLVLVTLVHQMELWPYIAAYLLCFGVVMVIVSGIVDRSIEALRNGRIEAEQAHEARSRFMAAASHDLGQPLQAARLFFEQTVAGNDAVHRRAAERNTRAALAAMERLVRQMLDHLRLEKGMVDSDLRRFPVREVIAAVAAQFEPLAMLGRIELRAVPGRLEASGDPELVERALGNLVDNALRHSRGSRIVIGARRHGRRVRLWVIDDGRGVAADVAPHLFEPFTQGSNEGRPRAGLGIGLSSVRALMTLMQGSGGIDPNWHKGSAFYLELPA